MFIVIDTYIHTLFIGSVSLTNTVVFSGLQKIELQPKIDWSRFPWYFCLRTLKFPRLIILLATASKIEVTFDPN